MLHYFKRGKSLVEAYSYPPRHLKAANNTSVWRILFICEETRLALDRLLLIFFDYLSLLEFQLSVGRLLEGVREAASSQTGGLKVRVSLPTEVH